MAAVSYILAALGAYLLGSIPTGFLFAKAKGIDIRTIGSGNIGATNVLRALGKPAGIAVLLADALKGYAAVEVVSVLIYRWCFPMQSQEAHDWLKVVAAICAILGHNYTCWLNFKGGKGIATSAGVLVALVPWALLIILGVWAIVFLLSRFVSLASICASVTLPFAAWLTGSSSTMVLIVSVMTVLAVYKHKANIKRLLEGTENRIGGKKPSTGNP